MNSTRISARAIRRLLPLLGLIAFGVAVVPSMANADIRQFGTTVPGISWGCPPADYKYGNVYSLADSGSVSKITAYMKGAGGAGSQAFRAMIYAANGAGGGPGTLLALSSEAAVAGTASPGWVDFPVNPSVHLTPGDYWIVQISGPSNGEACLSNVGGGAATFNTDAYGDGPSNPFSASGVPQFDASQWALAAVYTTDPVAPPADPVAPATPIATDPVAPPADPVAPATPMATDPVAPPADPVAPATPIAVGTTCTVTPAGCLETVARQGYCLDGRFLNLLTGQATWDPAYRGATYAVYVRGLGITCDAGDATDTHTMVNQSGDDLGPVDEGRVYRYYR